MHATLSDDDPLAIPPFLKVDKAEAKRRLRFWEKNPPKPMPPFLETTRSAHEEMTPEFRAQLDADYAKEQDWITAFKRPDTKKAKKFAEGLVDKKSKLAAPVEPIDRTGMRWGRTRGGHYTWVPDTMAPSTTGRGQGASPAAPGGGDRAKKPAATGGNVREREASPRVRGSSPRRSTTPPAAPVAAAAAPVARRAKGAEAKAQQRAAVMAMLTRPEGATLANIAPLTGPNNFEHTASAYLSGLRKEMAVAKTVEEGRGNVYRVAVS